MHRLIKIVLFLWVLLVCLLVVADYGKGFSLLVEFALLLAFILTTALVLTYLVT